MSAQLSDAPGTPSVHPIAAAEGGWVSGSPRRRLLLWHVHGAWSESFVRGSAEYLVPRNDAGDADGRGLAGRRWPAAREVPFAALADTDVDLVVLQRPHEVDLAHRLLGRRPGVDVPAVYVEHNAPRPSPTDSRHPLADRDDIPIVHVTDFNRLMWDSGRAPTTVVDHGIVDPGERYTGELTAAAVMINEPLRRGRVVGADLLVPLSAAAPLDVWGMGTDGLGAALGVGGDAPARVVGRGDVLPPALHAEIARRRVYLHTARWTSLGLSLLEAMTLGMPVVAVAATMAAAAVPPGGGVVSADVDTLAAALRHYLADPDAARAAGKVSRGAALARYGLERFLRDWDRVIEEACA